MKKHLLSTLLCLSAVTVYAPQKNKKVDNEVAAFLKNINRQSASNTKSPSPDSTTSNSPRYNKETKPQHNGRKDKTKFANNNRRP